MWCIFVVFILTPDVMVFGKEYDVVIVGAGLSGLGAGKYFTDQKIDSFIILEAQNYIGGRVKSTQFANETVSLGAGWIHGADESNTLFRLANKYNLKRFNDTYALNETIYRYMNNGSEVPAHLVKERVDKLRNAYDRGIELAEEKIERDGIDIDLETSLRWAGFVPKDALDHAVSFFYFDFENGVPPSEVASMSAGGTGDGVLDQLVTDKRGYFYPVSEETKSFHHKVRLNTEVTKIERLPSKTFVITTANGTTYNAKFVLVTVSSGVLNANAITFSPPLPDWKMEALNMVPMAYYCKIFLRFSNSFWDTDKVYIMFATMFKGQYMHWQNFDINGLFKGKSILLGTITGDTCLASHTLNDEELQDHIFLELKKVYPNATKPVEIIRTDFSINPFVRGSYSNQVPGITNNHYLALEHPVQQRLYMAGEHLGRWDYGFAHKSYDIGMEVAKNLTLCMKSGVCATDKPHFADRCKKSETLSAANFNTIHGAVLFLFTLTFLF